MAIMLLGWQQNNNEENRANTPAYFAKTLQSKTSKSMRSDKTFVFTGTYTIAENNTVMNYTINSEKTNMKDFQTSL